MRGVGWSGGSATTDAEAARLVRAGVSAVVDCDQTAAASAAAARATPRARSRGARRRGGGAGMLTAKRDPVEALSRVAGLSQVKPHCTATPTSASCSSRIEPYRWSGSFASARSTTASSVAGSPACTLLDDSRGAASFCG